MPPVSTTRRMIRDGAGQYLSDAELLQCLTGVSSGKARHILNLHNGRWPPCTLRQRELEYAYDLTEKQAGALAATMEVVRRVTQRTNDAEVSSQLSSPDDVARACSDMCDELQEQLEVVLLTTRMHVVDRITVYIGTCSAADIRPAEILRHAVIANAPNIIIVHNHPSGDTTPSPEDLNVTRELIKAADLMGVTLQDHVVVGSRGHTSIRHQKQEYWDHNSLRAAPHYKLNCVD